ncbi:vomeronasal type-1 receptor 4-like [Diceros bicornis minor]|uniref:vomeronasal type-1 receptor 4-like n=1 Tax=Diceros bicornis minor TaxID=77932 RepID=UPI0026F23405|nr:vomeronasal type-1 receptor 4-like [Diceros bicornis minor]
MATRDLSIGMMFLLQTIIGILGNFSLVYRFLFLYFTGCKFRSTDLILKHLTVANLLVILSKGVPETMAAFGLKLFLKDIGCKLVFYVHRVGRDVSIGTTCLLSVFQVIMISPSISRWAELKVKAPNYTGASNILCWILNMMLNILVPFHMTDKRNNTNIKKKIDHGYCYAVFSGNIITQSLYILLVLFSHGFCLVLMVWASGSMIFLLHRHQQRVQYIHRNNLAPRSSLEIRATQSILVLVSTFVSLWTLSSIFLICLAFFNKPSLWLKNISTLIAACFPTVSPYILMSHDPRVSRFCFA